MGTVVECVRFCNMLDWNRKSWRRRNSGWESERKVNVVLKNGGVAFQPAALFSDMYSAAFMYWATTKYTEQKFLLFSFVYDVERSGTWSQGFSNHHWSSLFTHSLAVTIHDSRRNYRCRWTTNICRLKLESGLSKACAEANISDRPKSYISVCKVSSRVRSNITRPTSMKI